jgi:putative ABC transport system substrate-binding protein
MSRLSRRQFVVGAGVAGAGVLAGCGRLPWQAPQSVRVPKIGVLSLGSPGTTATTVVAEGLRQGLGEHGYVEGQSLTVEWRFAEGRLEQLPALAAELVQLPVDIIVTAAGDATAPAKRATDTIPIVMTVSGDPVREGLVPSLARPEGNVTGLSALASPLSGKRLHLLKESVPSIAQVAILRGGTDSSQQNQFSELEVAASALGIELVPFDAGSSQELRSALEALSRQQADALLPLGSGFLNFNLRQVVDFAAEYKLPAIYPRREFVEAGGLMSYAPNLADMARRSAYFVDRILKGTKPADLPVEQPMRFEFIVNMRTARELGITFPHEVALQITEVIE